MIGLLDGTLLEKDPTRILVDVGGVGYEASISLSTYTELPEPGKPVSVRVHTHLRDNALQLFAFATALEREVFELLLHASRVGPKLAQTLLSGLPAPAVLDALRSADIPRLKSVSGVGAKTAERMVVELRDRVDLVPGQAGPRPPDPVAIDGGEARGQLLSALTHLQVPRGQAERIVDAVVDELGAEAGIEALVRAALPRLSRG